MEGNGQNGGGSKFQINGVGTGVTKTGSTFMGSVGCVGVIKAGDKFMCRVEGTESGSFKGTASLTMGVFRVEEREGQ